MRRHQLRRGGEADGRRHLAPSTWPASCGTDHPSVREHGVDVGDILARTLSFVGVRDESNYGAEVQAGFFEQLSVAVAVVLFGVDDAKAVVGIGLVMDIRKGLLAGFRGSLELLLHPLAIADAYIGLSAQLAPDILLCGALLNTESKKAAKQIIV